MPQSFLRLALFCGLGFSCWSLAACSGDERILFVDRGPIGAGPDGGVPSVLDTLVPGSDEEKLVKGYQELIELATVEATFWCECETESDEGEAFEECMLETDSERPPPVLECTKGVLAKHPHALPSLDCRLGLQRTYIACIQGGASCLDFDHITDCQLDRITNDLSCEELPWDVTAKDQELCWGREVPPPFTCKNGRIINSALKCDIFDDCGDRSDEQGCKDDPHGGVPDLN